jgi:hypothetical protein
MSKEVVKRVTSTIEWYLVNDKGVLVNYDCLD